MTAGNTIGKGRGAINAEAFTLLREQTKENKKKKKEMITAPPCPSQTASQHCAPERLQHKRPCGREYESEG